MCERTITGNIFCDRRRAGANKANTGSVNDIFINMQIVDRRTGYEARTGCMANTEVVAIHNVDDFAGAIESIHLPVGDQSSR